MEGDSARRHAGLSRRPAERSGLAGQIGQDQASGGQVPSYEVVKPELQSLPELGQGLGLRAELLAAIDRYDIVVNPRYQPLEMPLAAVNGGQSQIVLVSLPLGTSASPAVRDLPAA